MATRNFEAEALMREIEEFCSMLEAMSGKLTQTATLEVASQYDLMREKIIQNYSLDDFHREVLPRAVVKDGRTGANNVDLLAFAYMLRDIKWGKEKEMSYPDNYDNWLRATIEFLKTQKDNAVKNGDYPKAAQRRDELDRVQLALMEGKKKWVHPESFMGQMQKPSNDSLHKAAAIPPKSKYKKALIVPDGAVRCWLSETIVPDLQADVVITESGILLKNRYGKLPDPGRYDVLGRPNIEKALQCLSGDLNYDNVAEAKRILKNVLN